MYSTSVIDCDGVAGWIPSVTAGVSAEAALSEGTPGLAPDDLHLPALPPVDEEVNSAYWYQA